MERTEYVETGLIALDDIRAAADRIAPRGAVSGTGGADGADGAGGRGVMRTPLLPMPVVRGGPPLWLKAENLQPVGSFKIRGATNALSLLDDEARAAGVVTHSSGNHGRALAYAARAVGVACVVVVPEGAPQVKTDAMRELGAEVVIVTPAQRSETARRLAGERGLTLIPPFDDDAVIAGQGTVGLEILEDLPAVDTVLLPVGGGGLASGVATAVKELKPDAAVIGVEPELAADAAESLAVGRRIAWSPERTARTAADGVRVGLSDRTFAHLRERLDDILTVTEEEIRAAMGRIARRARVVAEPSGALAAAAVLSGRAPAGNTVAVVSGGNVDPVLLAATVLTGQSDDL
ncbi:threonine dehydratase [Nocardiopsis mwathae]|uniref:Threonine dehydratase n=1 Tax=Nocardiopsis mwathae TaxID=1472723 RepID=A0A7W9YH04_9ACTN|nr:threonine/serine dehydratase [Nocardiopsis mwathae]MBB6171982.1 threonine dehydratase [Nocardiopsis mwathae]